MSLWVWDYYDNPLLYVPVCAGIGVLFMVVGLSFIAFMMWLTEPAEWAQFMQEIAQWKGN